MPQLLIGEGKKYRGRLSWEMSGERGEVVRKGMENSKVVPRRRSRWRLNQPSLEQHAAKLPLPLRMGRLLGLSEKVRNGR